MALTPAQETALIAILDQANQILISELTAITAAQSTSAMRFEVELGGSHRSIAASELIQFINTQIQADLLAGETPLAYNATTVYDSVDGPKLVEFTPAGGSRGTYLYINNTAAAGNDPTTTSHWYKIAEDGLAGASAISNTTATFVQPASGSNVNLVLDRTTGVVVGSLIFHASGNYYRVVSVNSATGITVTNPTNFAATNTAPAATIAVGRLSTAGEQGQIGISAIANNAATFTQPASNATVVVAVDSGLGFAPNQIVQHSSGNTYRVNARTATSLTLLNLATHQDLNSAPATTISAGTFSPSGFRGVTGTTGASSVATNAATFTQPASDATVVVPVSSSAGFISGQVLYHSSGNSYTITAIPNATSLTLQNSAAFTSNSAPAATIAIGTFVSSGQTGATGATGATGTNGVATGDPMFFTATTIDTDGDLRFSGGSVSWHKNTRTAYLFPTLNSGDRLILQSETNSAQSASITLTAAPTFADPVYTAAATLTGTITAESNIRVLSAIRGAQGVAGADGIATGHKVTFTTGTVDVNGEIGGTTTLSIHQNDRDGNLLPLAGLLAGSILSVYDEANAANYSNWTLTANLTLTGSVYSATATRVNGGAIANNANTRLVIAPKGAIGTPGADGIATGHKVTFTTGTVDVNGEIGGTTTLSIHQNDRDGNLLPLAGLLSGSILSIYDEMSAANYSTWTLTANLTLTGSVYSATATRVNGGAIANNANARLVIAPRGADGAGGGGLAGARILAHEPNLETQDLGWTIVSGVRSFVPEFKAVRGSTPSSDFIIESPSFSGTFRDVIASTRFIATGTEVLGALSLRDATTNTELVRIQISGGNVFFAINNGSPQSATSFVLTVGVTELRLVLVANNRAYGVLSCDRLASNIAFEITGFTVNSANNLAFRVLAQNPTLMSGVTITHGQAVPVSD